MNVWMDCPECGDGGPHTIWLDYTDPIVVWCVNESCRAEFEVSRDEVMGE